MNWKNITLESGFVKQEINLNGVSAVNFIPVDQIDSFGIVNSENKRWLYIGAFFCACALLMGISNQIQVAFLTGIVACAFIAFYFMTRQTWLTITSSQTKFSVQVRTTKDEILAVNAFVMQIKQNINPNVSKDIKVA